MWAIIGRWATGSLHAYRSRGRPRRSGPPREPYSRACVLATRVGRSPPSGPPGCHPHCSLQWGQLSMGGGPLGVLPAYRRRECSQRLSRGLERDRCGPSLLEDVMQGAQYTFVFNLKHEYLLVSNQPSFHFKVGRCPERPINSLRVHTRVPDKKRHPTFFQGFSRVTWCSKCHGSGRVSRTRAFGSRIRHLNHFPLFYSKGSLTPILNSIPRTHARIHSNPLPGTVQPGHISLRGTKMNIQMFLKCRSTGRTFGSR